MGATEGEYGSETKRAGWLTLGQDGNTPDKQKTRKEGRKEGRNQMKHCCRCKAKQDRKSIIGKKNRESRQEISYKKELERKKGEQHQEK